MRDPISGDCAGAGMQFAEIEETNQAAMGRDRDVTALPDHDLSQVHLVQLASECLD